MVDVFRGYADMNSQKSIYDELMGISSTFFGRLFRRDAPLYGPFNKATQ